MWICGFFERLYFGLFEGIFGIFKICRIEGVLRVQISPDFVIVIIIRGCIGDGGRSCCLIVYGFLRFGIIFDGYGL